MLLYKCPKDIANPRDRVKQSKQAGTQGKPIGLHASDMAVKLSKMADRACEELGNPVKCIENMSDRTLEQSNR